jgi:ABC-type glycerol-3-phosphate transport system substrate-binding protein
VLINGFAYGRSNYGDYTDLANDELGRAYDRILLGQQSVAQAFKEANQNYDKRRENL